MAKFEVISLMEAQVRSATGRRAEIIAEYVGYIEQLQEGQAGKLQVTKGETLTAVRRRLGAASKLAGTNLIIRRSGDDIFFWRAPRRRGRPRKT